VAKFVVLTVDVRQASCPKRRHHMQSARLHPLTLGQPPRESGITAASAGQVLQLKLHGHEFFAYLDGNPSIVLPVDFVACTCGQGCIAIPEGRVRESVLAY
jgi:hypothetical protein